MRHRKGKKSSLHEDESTSSATPEVNLEKHQRRRSSTKPPRLPASERNSTMQPEDILGDCSIFQPARPPFWKRKRFHFIVGVTVGLLATYGASTTPTANDFQSYLSMQLAEMDFPSLMLPTGVLVDDLLGNFTSFFNPANTPTITEETFMPAWGAKDTMDLKPHFPVVIVPGVISSGLESWSTDEKARKYFRKRMWGTATMFRAVILDKESWIHHVRLDPVTGLDPPGAKIRAAQGLDAADYFVTGYWIWGKIIENLAAIGYDSNNMMLASYDWRLAFSNLEVRDKYFTKLKAHLETSKLVHGKKTVFLAHSMGSNVLYYFFKWVESPEGGNGGDQWVNDYVESFVNIGGPMLGVPKAMTALLSGETRDTISLGSFGAYLLEKFFSRNERASLLRTWAGGSSMLPKGGNHFWGNYDAAPDDSKISTTKQKDDMDKEILSNESHYIHTHGKLLTFLKKRSLEGIEDNNITLNLDEENNDNNNNTSMKDKYHYYSMNEALELLFATASKDYSIMVKNNYSNGFTFSKQQLQKNAYNHTKWANPLETQLPNAPNMKIYCLYGVGLPTERSYHYAYVNHDQSSSSVSNTSCENSGLESQDDVSLCLTSPGSSPYSSNGQAKDEEGGIKPPRLMYIDNSENDGVRFSDGDGTVPLLSLGFMCSPSNGAWTKYRDLYNPGHSPVKLKEYMHEESDGIVNVRGGNKAGDHVDILGNWEMTLDLLRIVSNAGENVTEQIYSNIEEISNRIPIVPQP
ncbi:Lecithin:cholesterol acyltransferase-domain-containing protein [Halteromyces radiatus]|uniref:Lecithin:cholesterol acyltransferase-domain-containing protein n=1 Tax=Halteromyces radiatus TaxID=101107 RepID=UPI002220F86A|nr:Lecithin:cholesterol acyltransferase-domain-containing protein [Halteromyces radiatus]KAI8093378.1 Lecithin:cholesterol acyltransferase-domain-containing protein [Halteromyces radiatus]